MVIESLKSCSFASLFVAKVETIVNDKAITCNISDFPPCESVYGKVLLEKEMLY